jgi:segregation and condensation protein B
MAETTPTNTPIILQVPTSVKALIEALIFGAREPLSVRQIQALYEDQGTGGAEPRKIDYEEINRSVEELNAEYTSTDRPYRIIQIAGGYQFATLPQYAEWLGKLYKEQTRRKLSQSSIETLAIIAYKQPITKPEIEAIRGVNCDYVLSTLLEKDLATIVGRAPSVGRPLLYGTSREFLRHFGLNDLNDLPRPREIQDILGDSQFESERRMLEAQQGVGEEKKEDDFKSRLPHIPKRKPGLDDDVKIVPKKRVRDIKVLPAEEKEAPKADEQPVLTEATESVAETPLVSETNQKVTEPVDTQSPVEQNIPTIENADRQDAVDALTEPEGVSTDEASSASLKYFEMPPTSEPKPAEEAVALEPIQTPVVDEPVVEEPATEENAEVTVEPPVDGRTIRSIQVEDVEDKLNEAKELAVSEERNNEVVEESVSQDAMENVVKETPQVVTPTIVEHTEIAAELKHELSEAHPSDSDVPHPKTRWKSWKEKIQGFIKKLFG